jgi:hypothetical protein
LIRPDPFGPVDTLALVAELVDALP